MKTIASATSEERMPVRSAIRSASSGEPCAKPHSGFSTTPGAIAPTRTPVSAV